eukprot:scaffold9279_cov68-Cylindrotheca_fusiformis.AAC.3
MPINLAFPPGGNVCYSILVHKNKAMASGVAECIHWVVHGEECECFGLLYVSHLFTTSASSISSPTRTRLKLQGLPRNDLVVEFKKR